MTDFDTIWRTQDSFTKGKGRFCLIRTEYRGRSTAAIYLCIVKKNGADGHGSSKKLLSHNIIYQTAPIEIFHKRINKELTI